jgi:hypothetical protein
LKAPAPPSDIAINLLTWAIPFLTTMWHRINAKSHD